MPSSKVRPGIYESTRNLFVVFRLMGHLMTDRFKALYFTYSLLINFTGIILIPQMYTLSYIMGDEKLQINQFLSSLQMCISTYTGVIKFCLVISMRSSLFKFKAIIDALDSRIKHPEEIREAQRGIQFGNQTVFIYSICYYGYSFVYFVASVCMGHPPFSFYNPFFSWRDSLTKLAIASILEYIMNTISITQQIINDTYGIIYNRMVHSHLKILNMKVLRIGTDPKCTQDDNYQELVHCIQNHKNIIELINTIRPVISATYFVQFLTTAAGVGASLINISISNDSSTLFGSAGYASCSIIQIFPICYLSNMLADEGNRLSEAIFQMNWIDQSPKFCRLCLFFMHRSQQTICFSAGKLFTITLDTFLSILKFSFSVYTLLNNIDFAERFKS